MTNVNDFKFDATKIMLQVSKIAPFALLICAMLSFLAIGIFAVDYYDELLKFRFGQHSRKMAIMIAVIQEFVRFALLVASIRDFGDKKPFNGWLGLIGSIALVIHDLGLAAKLSGMWANENFSADAYSDLLKFLILLSLLLEIRLVLTTGKTATRGKSEGRKEVENAMKNGSYQTV